MNDPHDSLPSEPPQSSVFETKEEMEFLEGLDHESSIQHPFLDWLDHSKRFLFMLVLLTFGLLSLGGLAISSLSAQYGLMVFGSDPALWKAGQPIALRLEGRELFLNHSLSLTKATAYFEHQKGQVATHVPLNQKVGPYLQGQLVLPKALGTWRLRIHAHGLYEPLGQSTTQEVFLETYLDFTLKKHTSTLPPPLEAADRPTSLKERQGKGTLSLFALNQRLPFELSSEILISALSPNNTPWSTSIELSEVMGLTDPPLPKEVETDQSGLARLKVKVKSPNLQFQIQSQDALTFEQFWPQAHHFTLKASPQLITNQSKSIQINMETDRLHPFLFLDIWIDGVWVDTHALFPKGKQIQHRLSLPPLPSQLSQDDLHAPAQVIWIQVYDSTYFPKDRKGGMFLLRPYQTSPPFLKNTLFPWLKDTLLSLKIESGYWQALPFEQYDNPNVIAFALGRFKRPTTDPRILSDSGTSSQIMIDQMKLDYQRWFMMGMLIFGCIVCFVLGLLMWNQHQKLKKQMWIPSQTNGHLTHENLTYSNRDLWIKWFIPALFLLICFFGGMMYLIWVLNQGT